MSRKRHGLFELRLHSVYFHEFLKDIHCKQQSIFASSECERISCDARCGKDEEDERSWWASAVMCHLNTKPDYTLSLLVQVLFCFVYSCVKTERGQIISFSPTTYFYNFLFIYFIFYFLLWRCDPTRVMASSFLRFSRSHTTTHHSR